jgi:hypothetical protein
MSDIPGNEKQDEHPELLTKPVIAKWYLLVMNAYDATYLVDSSGKSNYKNGHYIIMNPADAGNIT